MSNSEGYCQKTAEIAKLEQQVKTLNGIVMGNEGLAQTVPVLNRNVSELSKTIGHLTTGVSGLLQFQQTQIGQQEGKAVEKAKMESVRRRNRWIIGILVSAMVALMGGLLVMIEQAINH